MIRAVEFIDYKDKKIGFGFVSISLLLVIAPVYIDVAAYGAYISDFS